MSLSLDGQYVDPPMAVLHTLYISELYIFAGTHNPDLVPENKIKSQRGGGSRGRFRGCSSARCAETKLRLLHGDLTLRCFPLLSDQDGQLSEGWIRPLTYKWIIWSYTRYFTRKKFKLLKKWAYKMTFKHAGAHTRTPEPVFLCAACRAEQIPCSPSPF